MLNYSIVEFTQPKKSSEWIVFLTKDEQKKNSKIKQKRKNRTCKLADYYLNFSPLLILLSSSSSSSLYR